MGTNSSGPAPTRGPQASLLGSLRPHIERVGRLTTGLSAGMLAALLLTLFAMVVSREVFEVGIAWLDDLARYLQIWVVYTGAITLTMQGDHIVMDAVYVRLPAAWRRWLRRCTGLVSLCFCAGVAYLALQQALEIAQIKQVSASGYFPAWVGYASLPVGFALLAMASLYYLLYWSDQENVGSDVTGAI